MTWHIAKNHISIERNVMQNPIPECYAGTLCYNILICDVLECYGIRLRKKRQRTAPYPGAVRYLYKVHT